jgi:hypothetical protein
MNYQVKSGSPLKMGSFGQVVSNPGAMKMPLTFFCPKKEIWFKI